MLPIPAQADEIEPRWLSEALGTGPITSIEVERLGAGVGFQGDVLRLTPQYETDAPNAPRTVIVKLPMPPGPSRSFAELLGVYAREIGFYESLAADTPWRTPAPYYSAIEPEPAAAPWVRRAVRALPAAAQLRLGPWLAGRSLRRSVLLQEDLAPRRVGDQVAGCGVADAEVALRQLARFHAAFWRSPRLRRYPWLAPIDDGVAVTQALFRRAWGPAITEWGHLFDEAGLEAGRWLQDHGAEVLRRLARRPRTLLHGDYRLDNLFFGPGPDDLAVIDFQFAQIGRAAYDVAYFLCWSLDEADAIGALLGCYHQALLEAGVDDYDFDTFRFDYELACLAVIHRGGVILGTIDLSAERGQAIVESAIRRTNAALASIDLDEVTSRL